MTFLLEFAKVCQRYFFFSLQTRFGFADTPEDYMAPAAKIDHV